MTKPKHNDPSSPQVCITFTPSAKQTFLSDLSTPHQWSTGLRFKKHAISLVNAYGHQWAHFIRDIGKTEFDLQSGSNHVKTVVTLHHAFLGFTELGIPWYEIGCVDIRCESSPPKIETPAKPRTLVRSSQRPPQKSRVWKRRLSSLREWLALLSGLLAAAAVFVTKGQLFGLELSTVFGLASILVGTLSALAHTGPPTSTDDHA